MDKITQISVTGIAEPKGIIYSNGLMIGNQLILSGMTAGDPSGDAYEQSVRALQRVKGLVEGAGGKMADVVKLTVYLTDIADRPAFGKARSEFFSGRMPCSTLVAISALAQPGLVVEVDAMAFIGAG
ncbi:MAG: RidA family protein [Rhodospirillaceae bacterium]